MYAAYERVKKCMLLLDHRRRRCVFFPLRLASHPAFSFSIYHTVNTINEPYLVSANICRYIARLHRHF